MKSRTAGALCVLTTIVAGGIWNLRTGRAQQPQSGQGIPVASAGIPDGKAEGNYAAGDGIIHITSTAGPRHVTEALRSAAAELRNAEDDKAKSDAQAKLTELLQQYFEADIRHREEELAKIEERTKSLRALLERRRTKKQDIIDLQIKVLLNEADGLGFFNETPKSDVLGWGMQQSPGSNGQENYFYSDHGDVAPSATAPSATTSSAPASSFPALPLEAPTAENP